MKKNSPNGVFVPAGLLIGMGVGFLTDQFLAGMFIGLGAGLLLMTVAEIMLNNKSRD